MKTYSYQIDNLSVEVGCGGLLRLLENGGEVGGGFFPPIEGIGADLEMQIACDDSMYEAYVLLLSI